jgi:outer membrane receptor protein involved in Fe transport
MKWRVWSLAVLAAVVLVALPGLARAQGVSSAAVTGRVTDEAGAPVAEVEVSLVNTSTGERFARRSTPDGRYSFENVPVGGPYTLEARALGFEVARRTGLMLVISQRLGQDLSLRRAAVELAAVTVTPETNPVLSRSRTGAATFISDSAIRNLPTIARNFTDFLQTVPQVAGGGEPSVDGQNNRFNNIQIDGGVNNDLFGLSGSGSPGGQANAHPISIEAVREYQVLIAPFDVRLGNFTGGLVNAVTKSGTNEWHGSAYAYFQNQSFVGTDTGGTNATPITIGSYNQEQYGFSLGGPIVRDKAHLFVATDFQHYVSPFFSGLAIPPTGIDSTVGISAARADSVTQILKTKYGLDPGTIAAPSLPNPLQNVFAKLSLQLGTNSQLEVSENYANGYAGLLTRSFNSPASYRPGYELSNSGWTQNTNTNTARAKWTALLGSRFSNELLLGYSRIRDHRNPTNAPQILVVGDLGTVDIAAGADRFSQGNSLNQDIYELTENVTFPSGAHTFTVGTHNEFFHFLNVFFPESYGVWAFASPAALNAGTAYHYELAETASPTLRPQGPVADWNVRQYGFYAQDQWQATPKLTITAGLRWDDPILDHPVTNPVLDTTTGLKINTGNSPSGNALWSPRVGFHYDVLGDASTVLRGGVGIFSGRPPYVWVSNAFSNTGLEQQLLRCDTTFVRPFTAAYINPANEPTSCLPGGGAVSSLSRTINFFVPTFKFPQDIKVSLGADRRLPWDVVATFDFLYTKSVNQFYFTDLNLVGVRGIAAGEGGRALYTNSLTVTRGALTVQRLSNAFGQVIEHRNDNRDRSFSATWQFQKRLSDRLEFNAAYTYSHVEDVFSLTSSIASSNLNFAALDGTLDNRNLRTSEFDIPHKVTLSGTVTLPYQFKVSLIYLGLSGSPFGYTISGDANGDGIFGNDMVYVPRNAADMSMTSPAQSAAYDAYINGEDCLRENRGRLLPRNSCRNPWENFLNARVSKAFTTVAGQSVEFTADMLNVLNFLHSSWGLVRETTPFETENLLSLTGWDTANQRGIYAFLPQAKNRAQTFSTSRWLLQLGLRYSL